MGIYGATEDPNMIISTLEPYNVKIQFMTDKYQGDLKQIKTTLTQDTQQYSFILDCQISSMPSLMFSAVRWLWLSAAITLVTLTTSVVLALQSTTPPPNPLSATSSGPRTTQSMSQCEKQLNYKFSLIYFAKIHQNAK